MSQGNGGSDQFPDGKMSNDDEGKLRMRIGVVNGKVRIEFEHATTWVGLGPYEAANFAELIIKHARKAANDTGVVLTIKI